MSKDPIRRQQIFLMKAIFLGLFAVLLLDGSACTRVFVLVRVPSESSLTGLNCKLKSDIRNQQQKTDFWCWAAAAQTVIEYLKQEPVRQCDLVQAVFRNRSMDPSRPCCLAEDDPDTLEDPPCAANGLSEYVFDTPEFNMGYDPVTFDWTSPEPQGLEWEEIVSEICEDRPIISAIAFTDEESDGGGHAVVIGGYKESADGSQWVEVYDPSPSTLEEDFEVWSYDYYRGVPGIFAHARTYKNISVRH
jgi:hypothetical protein